MTVQDLLVTPSALLVLFVLFGFNVINGRCIQLVWLRRIVASAMNTIAVRIRKFGYCTNSHVIISLTRVDIHSAECRVSRRVGRKWDLVVCASEAFIAAPSGCQASRAAVASSTYIYTCLS